MVMTAMDARVKSEFWISAYRRKLELTGGGVTIIRRGDGDAGQIYLILRYRSGEMGLLSAVTELDGGRGWRVVLPLSHDLGHPQNEEKISDLLAREVTRDRDCWIIEAEPSGREHHLDEPISGVLDTGSASGQMPTERDRV